MADLYLHFYPKLQPKTEAPKSENKMSRLIDLTH